MVYSLQRHAAFPGEEVVLAEGDGFGGTMRQDVHSIGEYGFRAEVLDSEGNCIALHAETEGSVMNSL